MKIFNTVNKIEYRGSALAKNQAPSGGGCKRQTAHASPVDSRPRRTHPAPGSVERSDRPALVAGVNVNVKT